MFTFQMFSSADESLKEETCLLLLWDGLLVTLHKFVSIHIASLVEPEHAFMASSRVSKSCSYICMKCRYTKGNK